MPSKSATPKITDHSTAGPQKAHSMQPREIDGFTIYPMSLSHLWVFEELKHPFHTGGQPQLENGEPKRDEKGVLVSIPLTTAEIVAAIFVFHDPSAAHEALTNGRAVFNSEAIKVATTMGNITTGKVCAAIGEEMTNFRMAAKDAKA